MRKHARLGFAVLAFAALIPALRAQQGFFRPPEIQGVWNPVVGSGGSYESRSASGEKSVVDAFVVGKESLGGKDAYWIEIVKHGTGDSSPAFMLKSLATFDAGVLQISKSFVQIGTSAPLELPIQESSETSLSVDIRGKGQKAGSETITTPAGKFVCEHWRSEDGGDYWISSNVSPYGLVKSANKDGGGLTLIRRIRNAKDKMTAAPKSSKQAG